MDDGWVPLDTLPTQAKGFIRRLCGGHGFVSRLLALGFTPGAPVTVIQNHGQHGPIIVLVRDCRIALGRGEARKVLVQREG